jgi:hypothetical protein
MGIAATGFLRRGLHPSVGIAPASRVAAFLESVEDLRLSRLRLGAAGWELLVDPERPDAYVETFPMGSWADYVAAETVRLTVPEHRLRERVRLRLDHEPRTRVLLRAPHHRGADR